MGHMGGTRIHAGCHLLLCSVWRQLGDGSRLEDTMVHFLADGNCGIARRGWTESQSANLDTGVYELHQPFSLGRPAEDAAVRLTALVVWEFLRPVFRW